jgi:hypothetical protein
VDPPEREARTMWHDMLAPGLPRSAMMHATMYW